MKFRSLIYAMSLLLAVPFFAACNDDDTQEEVTTIETTRIKNVTYDSAVAVSYIVGNYSDCGICYSENENPTIAGKTLPAVGKVEFLSEITGLTSGKTYYVRTYAIVNGKPVYGAQKSFTTVSDGQPAVSVPTVSNVTEISALLKGHLMATGGKKVTTRGLAWVKDNGDLDEVIEKIATTGVIPDEVKDRAGIYTETEGSVGEFYTTAEDLDDESTYGVVAFAVAGGEVFHGDVETFKTVAYKVPVASIVEVKDVTGFSMTVKCKIETVNPLEVTARGILFGTSTLVGSATEVAATAAGEGEFEVTLDGLNEGTTYYLWAYGENRKGRATSARTSQATLSAKPVVEIGESLTNVIGHSVNATMKVTSLGVYNAPLTEVGFVYGTTSAPTITSSTCTKVLLDNNLNVNENYESVLCGMAAESKYYVRAFATNEYGTSYSSTLNATTIADFYDSYIRLFEAGRVDPYFSGGQANAISYHSNYGTTVTKAYCSKYFLDIIEGMQAAYQSMAAPGNFGRFRWFICATDEAGTDLWINLDLYYVDSAGSNKSGTLKWKLQRNSDGSFVAYGTRLVTTGYNTIMNALSAEHKAVFNNFFNFFSEPFYFDYISSSVTSSTEFRFVHKDKPEEWFTWKKLGFTDLAPSNPWN